MTDFDSESQREANKGGEATLQVTVKVPGSGPDAVPPAERANDNECKIGKHGHTRKRKRAS